ncbi:MAG: Stp1/IreP family PP2C-type Ser/Thr phosphatase [Myxococcales bacterium]|nr:Stp1/IreP family PP2C-type Ser/Thr phosphatase [Myxococcales bacterium]MCB9522669.1 Stp1/IreP family PP2C-type Ser/Thr phosphatase [Myxococcales bacterium]
MRFISGGATDVGQVREVNEDAFALVDQECAWILADGMGGHVGGKIASNLAVDAIRDFIARWRHAPDFEWPFEIMPGRSFVENSLANAVRVANVRVYNQSEWKPECQGMGTTVVVMAYTPEQGMVVAHVGDSRCYRLRGEALTQLTVDHSLVNHLMRFFHLSEVEARKRAGSNVIVRAVGLEDDVEADLTQDMPQAGDLYMSCSDGLSDLVDDWTIQNIMLNNAERPQAAAEALVRAANAAGGTDNITVIVLKALPA